MNDQKRLNIKDIAKLAGVSTSTVSKVLNQKDNDISIFTREKILRIARENHYVLGSKLNKKNSSKSFVIEIISDDSTAEYKELFFSVKKNLSQTGYHIFINHTDINHLYGLPDRPCPDGIIFIGDTVKYKGILEKIKKDQIPCVITDTQSDRENIIPYSEYIQEEIAYMAVSYLINHGHSNIGCFIPENSIMERGYRKALYRHKVIFDGNNIFDDNIYTKDGLKKFKKWLMRRKTAIFCADAERAVLACRTFAEYKILIPDDISIISARDSPYLPLAAPSITAVMLKTDEWGRQIVNELKKQIANGLFVIQSIPLPVEIQERNSVQLPNKT